MNPLIEFTYSPSSSPQETLRDFVADTGRLLESITFDKDCEYLTEDYAKKEMKDAWKEISSPVSSGQNDLVYNYSRQVFHSETAILKHHGLTDNNLKLKFTVLNHLWVKFKKAHADVADGISTMRDSFRRIAWSWLDKLLDVINKIFRSLLAAVPGGGALEEYKSMVESLIPDDEDN